jgi:hypothetical protein
MLFNREQTLAGEKSDRTARNCHRFSAPVGADVTQAKEKGLLPVNGGCVTLFSPQAHMLRVLIGSSE